MPTVSLEFTPLPSHVQTARLIAAAVARRSSLDHGLLDDVKLAVGEVCGRAVRLHLRAAPAAPVQVILAVEHDRFAVTVCDQGPAGADLPVGAGAPAADGALATDTFRNPLALADAGEPAPAGLGIALAYALVDEVSVTRNGGATQVRLVWSLGGRSGGGDRTGGGSRAGAAGGAQRGAAGGTQRSAAGGTQRGAAGAR